MSSPLDARIRKLAREEFAASGSTPTEEAGPDRVTELEKEVADLRTRLEKLEGAPAKRTARKTTEPAE